MPVYLVSNVKATSEDWIPEYAQKVHGIAAKHGGKYLSRSGNITAIEGERPNATIVALMQFPSMDALQGFINDPVRPLCQGAAGREQQHPLRL